MTDVTVLQSSRALSDVFSYPGFFKSSHVISPKFQIPEFKNECHLGEDLLNHIPTI